MEIKRRGGTPLNYVGWKGALGTALLLNTPPRYSNEDHFVGDEYNEKSNWFGLERHFKRCIANRVAQS